MYFLLSVGDNQKDIPRHFGFQTLFLLKFLLNNLSPEYVPRERSTKSQSISDWQLIKESVSITIILCQCRSQIGHNHCGPLMQSVFCLSLLRCWSCVSIIWHDVTSDNAMRFIKSPLRFPTILTQYMRSCCISLSLVMNEAFGYLISV